MKKLLDHKFDRIIDEVTMKHIHIDQLLELAKNSFQKDAAKGINTIIKLNLKENELEKVYSLQIKNQICEIKKGEFGRADVIIETDQDILLGLLTREINPFKAFFLGQIKINGDQSAVMKIASLFNVDEEKIENILECENE